LKTFTIRIDVLNRDIIKIELLINGLRDNEITSLFDELTEVQPARHGERYVIPVLVQIGEYSPLGHEHSLEQVKSELLT